MKSYRSLTDAEISHLIANRCSAESWSAITVAEAFDPNRVYEVSFRGQVQLGENDGTLLLDGLYQPCGIYQATLQDCEIGDQVRICRISSGITRYRIEDQAVLEDLALLKAEPDATFGQGVEVQVLNEAGGRTVFLFNDLNAQIAYMQALFRHDESFQRQLLQLIQQHIAQHRPTQGVVEQGAHIQQCGTLLNVQVGAGARLNGVAKLVNGTVLSCPEHPTYIGADVIASNFIIAEGAEVKDGAMLDKVYVGQAARVGKQFSAENSVLFANSEAFHSEVCSIFAGPYTVTHHRSTLLIAGLFSFFNAGSGTNQSNHMYKLGPLHQGIFERGSKTGSFAYTLFECHIPAFSVVIGKHLANIDIPLLPFSYITQEEGGSMLRPAINLFAVGTIRDGVKWPSRDRRQAGQKRDLIVFDVFSPYTVEKMRRGRDLLKKLYDDTPREKEYIHYGGLQMSRLLLAKGAKYYGLAIDRYLVNKLLVASESALRQAKNWSTVLRTLAAKSDLQAAEEWMDLSGLLTRKARIQALMTRVGSGQVTSIAELLHAMQTIWSSYAQDEWDYVCYAFAHEYGVSPDQLSIQDFSTALDRWQNATNSLNALLQDNAAKEFAPFSQIGYGLDWGETEKALDFKAVRGTKETHPVIKQIEEEKQHLEEKTKYYRDLLNRFQP